VITQSLGIFNHLPQRNWGAPAGLYSRGGGWEKTSGPGGAPGRQSATKPISRWGLARHVERMMTSRSCPWNPSTELRGKKAKRASCLLLLRAGQQPPTRGRGCLLVELPLPHRACRSKVGGGSWGRSNKRLRSAVQSPGRVSFSVRKPCPGAIQREKVEGVSWAKKDRYPWEFREMDTWH